MFHHFVDLALKGLKTKIGLRYFAAIRSRVRENWALFIDANRWADEMNAK